MFPDPRPFLIVSALISEEMCNGTFICRQAMTVCPHLVGFDGANTAAKNRSRLIVCREGRLQNARNLVLAAPGLSRTQ
jgi:hypothetical protein